MSNGAVFAILATLRLGLVLVGSALIFAGNTPTAQAFGGGIVTCGLIMAIAQMVLRSFYLHANPEKD